MLADWKKSCDKPRQHIKKQRHHFANKSPSSQSYGFSSSHVRMWELDHKKGWAPTCGAGEDSRVPCTARTLNQSILKEINPEYSLEGLMLKLKLQYFWPPDVKTWLTRKDLNAGKDWRQEEKGTTEDEMAGWHHWLDGHEFEWTPGVGDGQRGLACCNSWGCKESDMTEQLNWTGEGQNTLSERLRCFFSLTL